MVQKTKKNRRRPTRANDAEHAEKMKPTDAQKPLPWCVPGLKNLPNLFTCLIKEFYLKGSINFTMPWIVPLLHHLFPLVLNNEGAHAQIFHLEGPIFLQLKLIFSLLNTENRIKQQEPTRAGADGRGMHGDVDNNTHTVDHTPFQSAQRGHMFTKQNKSSRLELSLVLAATIWSKQ